MQAIRNENQKGFLQTVRPEALLASFQTKRIQNICMLSYEKTGSRYEKDAEEPSDRELEKFPFRQQTGSLWDFLSD